MGRRGRHSGSHDFYAPWKEQLQPQEKGGGKKEGNEGEREGGKEGTFFQGVAAPIKLWPRPWWGGLVQHGQLACVEHLLVILGASPT